MATIRDTIQAEINDLQAKLTAKQTQLSTFEGTAGAFLNQEAEAVKYFVLGAWSHIFGNTPVPTPAATTAPAAAAPEQTGVTQ